MRADKELLSVLQGGQLVVFCQGLFLLSQQELCGREAALLGQKLSFCFATFRSSSPRAALGGAGGAVVEEGSQSAQLLCAL